MAKTNTLLVALQYYKDKDYRRRIRTRIVTCTLEQVDDMVEKHAPETYATSGWNVMAQNVPVMI